MPGRSTLVGPLVGGPRTHRHHHSQIPKDLANISEVAVQLPAEHHHGESQNAADDVPGTHGVNDGPKTFVRAIERCDPAPNPVCIFTSP